MGINVSELLGFIYNGGDSVTLLGTIMILSMNRGSTGGHIHNLGFTLCPVLIKKSAPMEHMVS